MWQFLEAALWAIPAAGTNAYALGAYALAILAYVITAWRVVRNKNLLENIEKLPPKDRLSALEVETGGVRLAKGISPEQWVRSRIHQYYLFAFLATCAVAVAIAALALLKGAGYAQTLTIINNHYAQAKGEPLSGPDLQHIENLVKAAMTRDLAGAQTSFKQLSEPARRAYQSAYQEADASAKDTLVSPQRLSEAPPQRLSEAATPASSIPPRAAASTREAEPNDDILKAHEIPLNATITAAIESPSDADFFTFTLPGNRRDIIDVILNNDSTTLAPRITVYNPDKGVLDAKANGTAGADLSYEFVARPNNRYFVGVSPYGNTQGSYRLTARAKNAFDEYEPNDDILNPSPIAIGKTIDANIMDPGDADFYRFETQNLAKVAVSLENRSSTLAPRITVYNPDKGVLDAKANGTAGADLSYAFGTQPNSRYYVSVSPYGNTYGAYKLTVRPE